MLRLGHLLHASESFFKASEATASASVKDDKELASVRNDGKNGLKSVAGARSSFRRLGQLESSGDSQGALVLLEDLISTCPCSLLVLTSKCNALCRVSRWSEAKACADEFICNAHSSVLRLAAHPNAQLPAPSIDRLAWIEKVGKNIVSVDTAAVVQSLLVMGPGLAEIYLSALRNLDFNRTCCSDIMTRILLIFDELVKILKASLIVSVTADKATVENGKITTPPFKIDYECVCGACDVM